jgi:hypothetical protein
MKSKVAIHAVLATALLSVAVLPVSAFASSAVTANPYGASSVDPAGPNEVILTIKNKSITVTYKLSDLIKLATQDLTIHEPFVKKVQKFKVIPLTTLFKKAAVSPSQQVSTQALNDYIYANKASEFIAAKGYLAVERSGVQIPYDQGGPIRIIFPDNSKWAKFLDPWNWSISKIVVK